MSWNPGHLLKSGQYEVIRLIGSGGFGMTYLAKDLNLVRQVVIKRPNLSFEADRDYDKFLRRFKREGQLLAQVQIPNIVRVIEFTDLEGMPCLVMDFVAGETLNECIRRRKFIPENEAWQIFQKLASAVEALHQQGIIHCDIHPGNIIVQPNGEPVLIDFGSTKLLHPTTWTVTTTVNKDYGPYEQMPESESNNINPQPDWDIYSLAANMFFAVTGQKPMSAISRKLYGDTLKAPKKLRPYLTENLNQMILRGMSLEMKDRPQSVKSWINSLGVFHFPRLSKKHSLQGILLFFFPSKREKRINNILVAVIFFLSIVSGYTSINGAIHMFPPGVGVLVGVSNQIILFLFLVKLTPVSFPVTSRILIVSILTTFNIYFSFQSYYENLSGRDNYYRMYDYAMKAHNSLSSKVYTPLKNQLSELQDESKNIDQRIMAERIGLGDTRKAGEGQIAKSLEARLVLIKSKIEHLEKYFNVETKQLSPIEILEKDRIALKEVPYELLPIEYQTENPQSKIKITDYIENGNTSKFLVPYYQIMKGDAGAVIALYIASMIDAIALILSVAIR